MVRNPVMNKREKEIIEAKIRYKARMKTKKQEIKELEEQYGLRKPKKKPSSTKLLLIAMMFLFFEMIVYSEIVMWVKADLSALYALIGIAAAMAASMWAYCTKSGKENTKGGIVYDLAMKEHENSVQPEEDPEDPEEPQG